MFGGFKEKRCTQDENWGREEKGELIQEDDVSCTNGIYTTVTTTSHKLHNSFSHSKVKYISPKNHKD